MKFALYASCVYEMTPWKLPVHKITGFFFAFTYIYANNSLSICQHLEQVKLLLTHLLSRNFFRDQLDENIIFHENILDSIWLLFHHRPSFRTAFFVLGIWLIFFMSLLTDVLHLGMCILVFFLMFIRILTWVVRSFHEDKNHYYFL